MSANRQKLQEALCRYTSDTLAYFATVRDFFERSSKWMLGRKTELNLMMDIKERADKIDLNLKHIVKSKNKGEAIAEYVSGKVNVDSKREELEKELVSVLKKTLRGLRKLSCFLDALEKLAVTSLYVFMENQVLHLPEEISFDDVQVVIIAARQVCHLLLEFKRDANAFFLPKLQNVGVLSYQLDKYIQTTQIILYKLKESSFSEFDPKMNMNTVVDLDVNLSEGDVQRMFSHIDQLDKIRKDQDFRMVFLFQEEETCSDFIREFSERKPRMLQFLEELEENAVQVDRMSEGAKISRVASRSVEAVGGVLSVVGFALAPVTAGATLGLAIGGAVMAQTRRVSRAVTNVTERAVNRKHQQEALVIFKNFIDDVQVLQDCLEEVSRWEINQIDVAVGVGKVLYKAGAVGKDICNVVDTASSQALDLSGSINELISASALFFGMNIFYICKDSKSLAKGSESELSQFIRAKAALWSSEIKSWQKIHDSLSRGLLLREKIKTVLERLVYPDMEV